MDNLACRCSLEQPLDSSDSEIQPQGIARSEIQPQGVARSEIQPQGIAGSCGRQLGLQEAPKPLELSRFVQTCLQ